MTDYYQTPHLIPFKDGNFIRESPIQKEKKKKEPSLELALI